MRKALVVGINDYPRQPLSGCVNDANNIATVLETHADGAPNFAVELITKPGENITQGYLTEKIEKLFLKGESDVALFYFSGHGIISSRGGYLVTPDHEKYDPGVPMDTILTLANLSKAKYKIILLDCCHSGGFASPAVSGGNIAQLVEGISVLTASRGSEEALESGGSGVFTSLLVDALKGGASDLMGNITPGSIYAYVDRALGALDQRPIFKTNVSRFTSLRKVSPPVPLEILRKICIYFKNPEDDYELDPSFEHSEKSADEGNVAIFRELQKFNRVGLVTPVDEEHMYYAAINSKSCKLTAIGQQYWRLANDKKL